MNKPLDENIVQKKEKLVSNSIDSSTKEKSQVNSKKDKKTENALKNSSSNFVNNTSSKKKKILLIIIPIILIVIALFFSVIFSIIFTNRDTILPGITINNIDVSNMTKEEAISTLNALVKNKTNSNIEFSYYPEDFSNEDSDNTYETAVNFSTLEINYDITSAVNEAYNLGKTKNIFQNNFDIIFTLLQHKNYDIDISLNQEYLDNCIDDISKNLPNKLIQYNYYTEDDNLIITKGTAGNIVNEEEFANLFYLTLGNISSSENHINVPISFVQPDNIDVEYIHSQIYKEPQNAYYEEEPFKVYSETDGVDFDIDEVKTLILENPDSSEYTVELKYTSPEITLEDLDVDIFPDLLSEFSTKYDGTNKDRTTNLELAAEKINGTILSPGEEFSYNLVVGERTIEAGYKEAKIYSNGEVVDGLGGGICQISSTLYNAVMFANLEVTERYNHQFVTSYVSEGRDATVVYGVKDFKFVNNRSYPIKILMSINSGVAKVEIYGIKEDVEYDISFDVELVSTIPYTVKYENTSSLDEGEEKTKQNGANGKIVNVYKVTKQNSKIISRTLISKDTYNAMQKIVLKGTKSTEDSSDNNSSNSTSENVDNNTSTNETNTNSNTENATNTSSENYNSSNNNE